MLRWTLWPSNVKYAALNEENKNVNKNYSLPLLIEDDDVRVYE